MIQVDMHVHSRFSSHPARCCLGRHGTNASYTDVEEVYRIAKERGMTYVTVTDHDTIDGALALHDSHPADTFISAEVTSCFPDDGCRVHVLVYGISREQFDRINSLRWDIHGLRNYLRSENIACSVGHAAHSISDCLSVEAVEKLVLLFDIFEGINGGRTDVQNRTWVETLQSLTPAHISSLSRKHGIEPWGRDSWIKGLTGGSGDYSGLFIGQTVTLGCDATIPEFLGQIKQREARPAGRHADNRLRPSAVDKFSHKSSVPRRRKSQYSLLAPF